MRLNLLGQPEEAFDSLRLCRDDGSLENLPAQLIVTPNFWAERPCMCDRWRMLKNKRLAWVARK